ncbi:MAG: short-chain fatty acid transporter [Pseudonocardiaceae bacterium]|nr:short-chain fatty acid transporter [Pseudonocardiaceae bacterium]
MRTIARFFSRIVERWLPDAFIFLVLLTVLVAILGMVNGASPREVIDHWGGGFFEILEFTMQATLMLVTGYALANTRPVRRVLRAVARIPRTEVQVIIVTVFIMMVCSWISWAFGLVGGALVAREMGVVHRGKIHYPLVVASAYAGFLVWHAGYGGSIPQLIATPGHFLEKEIGVIGVGQTIFAPQSYIPVLALAIVVPLTLVLMRPKNASERIDLPDHLRFDDEPAGGAADPEPSTGVADKPGAAGSGVAERESVSVRMERSRVFTMLLGALGLLYLISYFAGGEGLNINIVIFSFLVAGLLLIRNTREYLHQVMNGARTAFGIIIQFPFYGAIMGIMSGTGLVAVIADLFVSISSANTLPFWSFLSGGIVNCVVPSGGGQWSVQGPIMMEAAQQLHASPATVAMGVAWGDAWTNMIQPFWAIPILAIAGLSIRHIMGYTAVVLLTSGVVIGLSMLLL